MADGVLLDWEGVLADTADARRDALQRALAGEGIAFDRATYDHLGAGRSVRAAAHGPETPEECPSCSTILPIPGDVRPSAARGAASLSDGSSPIQDRARSYQVQDLGTT